MPAAADTNAQRRGLTALCVALFFCSGAAGLVYEVLWSRMLTLEMGSTAYALATILTVFMGGLALGSAIGGRFGARIANPLRAYAMLEIGIGLYCLLTPTLIDALHPPMRLVYQRFEGSLLMMSLAQSLLCALVLTPPVVAMGATFPILAQFVTRSSERIAWSVGALYGFNTLGAGVGAVLSGLTLIPALGVSMTNHVAVVTNIAVGALALLASRMIPRPAQAATSHEPAPVAAASAPIPGAPSPLVLLIGFGISGFAAMTLQTAWTRLMSLSIGSATYAFSLIVGAFILGLALGSVVIGRLGNRPSRAPKLLILCQMGVAIAGAITIPLFGELPLRVSLLIAEHPESLARIQRGEFLAIAAIVLPPTFLMGGLLPLVCQCLASATRRPTSSIVGRAYVANTVGTILGSALAGFLLVPTIGMRGSIVVGVILYAIVGAWYLVASRGALLGRVRALVASTATIAITGLVLLLPAWDRAVITSGPYINAIALGRESGGSREKLRAFLNRNSDIIAYREGVATTVTVRRVQGRPWLLVSGKLEAPAFEFTQAFLAHLPLLLHKDPRSALVIGLGSGCTLNSATLHENLERIDCVEISPGVIDAARRYFDRDRMFADPRVRIYAGDGRLRLAMTDSTYDVIISQPSNPWMTGASAMFTRECFDLMRDRLNPDGVACVWFQGFQVSPETLRTIIGTFGDVFPNNDLWISRVTGDYLLTGSPSAYDIDPARIRRGLASPAIAGELAQDRVLSAADFLGRRLGGGATSAEFAADAQRNTDDRTVLEERIPREMFQNHRAGIVDATALLRSPIRTRLVGADEALQARLSDVEAAQRLIIEAFQLLDRGDTPGSNALILRARELDPNNYWCRDADRR
ncbi:MAG: fused MFS/spermidine synthase [Phycisphaeraceae bacterium]|nr:fused MFS/spermidine synthase [Phycisphaeraceae bacterium]MCB9848838.1 fused MFS/spermidine synthase [Phycisphaeraceae bacterium]